MKICFVLPQMVRKPIGGYKIIYEYANRLCERGHEVILLFLNENALQSFALPNGLRNIMIHIFTKYEPRWFNFDRRVAKVSSTDKIDDVVKKVDVAIATSVDTVDQTLEMFSNCNKYYFIQDYEVWGKTAEEVHETFGLGMNNIVISNWLKAIVDKFSKSPSFLLPNPIDTNKYKMFIDPDSRDEKSIGVLYHEAKHKGFIYAYDAILKVKKVFPDIKVHMFGTSIPDFEMPDWVDFKYNASQDDTINIYNNVSVFVCATIEEGFGLTGLEAMACGAALASTEYESVKEYARNYENSLLSPIKDVEALADNIIRLIQDKALRIKIAREGICTAQMRSWDKAVRSFDNYLVNTSKRTTEI